MNNIHTDKALIGIKEACEYLGIRETKGRAFLKEIGALVKIGARSLYNKSVIDSWIDEHTEN